MVSAGGAIDGCKDLGQITPEQSQAKILGIGDTLKTIFDNANRENLTTEAAAQALARERIAQLA